MPCFPFPIATFTLATFGNFDLPFPIIFKTQEIVFCNSKSQQINQLLLLHLSLLVQRLFVFLKILLQDIGFSSSLVMIIFQEWGIQFFKRALHIFKNMIVYFIFYFHFLSIYHGFSLSTKVGEFNNKLLGYRNKTQFI